MKKNKTAAEEKNSGLFMNGGNCRLHEHGCARCHGRKSRHSRTGGRSFAAVCAALLLAGNLAACGSGGSGLSGSDTGETGGAGEAGGAGSTSAMMADDVVPFQVPENSSYTIPEEKSETVNVTADAAGNAENVNVEVDLSGISGSDPILDCSHLTEIQNTEGDEAYTAVGDARYAWENEGEDIHYKGVSKSDLPVSVRIRYYLDGKEMEPQEMAGQSGKVKIRFEYTNNSSERVELTDGTEKEAPVPFLMLSTALLDGNKFTDIEVDHGRAIDLGDQTAAIVYGLPGVEECLKLTDYEPTEDVEIPESAEITAQVTDFSLDFTATVASTGLFGNVEDKDLDDLDEVQGDMDDLTDASSELVDAADELSGGGDTFGKYLGLYISGISAVAQGTGALDEGLQTLEKNGAQLTAGAESLQQGLSDLESALAQIDLSSLSSEESDKAAQAAAAALQSIGTDAQTLGGQLEEMQETLTGFADFVGQAQSYKESVEAVQAAAKAVETPSLDDVMGDLTASLEKQATEQAADGARKAAESAAEKAAAAAADKASKITQDKIGQSLSEEVKGEISSAAKGAVEGAGSGISVTIDIGEEQKQTAADKIAQAYAPLMEAIDKIPDFTVPDSAMLDTAQLQEIENTLTDMQESLGTVSTYAQNLSSLTEPLSSLGNALSQLQTGVSALREGSEGLTQGTEAFMGGVSQLAEGSAQLNQAMEQAADAGGELSGGYEELESGLEAFADGVSEFDEEGIGALADLAGDDFQNVVSGIRALKDAELSYDNYSGILDGQKGSVRFIIETDEIEEE